jgi:hypothetical protein
MTLILSMFAALTLDYVIFRNVKFFYISFVCVCVCVCVLFKEIFCLHAITLFVEQFLFLFFLIHHRTRVLNHLCTPLDTLLFIYLLLSHFQLAI